MDKRNDSQDTPSKNLRASQPVQSETIQNKTPHPQQALSQPVKTKESELERRERVVSAKEKKFEEKLQEAKSKLANESQAIREQKELLKKQEADLIIRQRELADLEVEANAGFVKRNREALGDLEIQHEELLAKLTGLQKQLIRTKTSEMEKLANELEEEARNRRELLEKEIQKRRESEEAELDERRKVVHEELNIERERLAKEAQTVKDKWIGFEEERAENDKQLLDRDRELRARQRELEADQALLAQEYETLELKVRKRAENDIQLMQTELQSVKNHNVDLLKGRSKLEEKVTEIQERYRWLEGKSPDEIAQRIQYLEREKERLEGELSLRPQKEVEVERDQLRNEKEKWDEDRRTMFQEVTQLRTQKSAWDMSVSELESMKNEKEWAQRQRDTLKAILDAELAKLMTEVQRVQRLYEDAEEYAGRIEAIQESRFTPAQLNREQTNGHVSEIEWLKGIQEDCSESKLRFNKRILWAFHTCLKIAEWSPLTVLAGVSGTGKSELPRLYARFCGILFEPLAVQPNWDSPQSLFGFFNSVDNKFNATTLLQALVQSQKPPEENGFNDFLLLVLLDEMNLAYVELYFSDMLSLLEQRRGKREPETLMIDVGAGQPKFPVELGLNVIWSGTMNQDETTKSLSDKVLDRGNIISFPRPTKLRRREKLELAPARGLLPFNTWNTWQRDATMFNANEINPYKDFLDEMNGHLEFAGRAIGHRVWQSIEAFMANYPSVTQAKKENNQDLEGAMKTAFEDQVVQKVMPKLRGIETTGRQAAKCLEPIEKMLKDFDLNLSEDFKLAKSSDFGGFNWSSAKYLETGE